MAGVNRGLNTMETEHNFELNGEAVRGSLLIAVMIHVIAASTLDYHSEVDTISH